MAKLFQNCIERSDIVQSPEVINSNIIILCINSWHPVPISFSQSQITRKRIILPNTSLVDLFREGWIQTRNKRKLVNDFRRPIDMKIALVFHTRWKFN